MTPFSKDQAAALAALFTTADGGCGHCADDLRDRAKLIDPTTDWDTLVNDAKRDDLWWAGQYGKAELAGYES